MVDKLILGIFLVVIGLFIEFRLKEFEKINDTILTVSKVNTEIIVEQRKRLNSNMTELIRGFRDLKGRDGVDDEAIKQLHINIKEISNSLYQIESLGLAVEMNEGSLSNLASVSNKIQEMQETVVSRILSDKEIDNYISALRTEYRMVLETIRMVSIRTVKHDRKVVMEHLMSDDSQGVRPVQNGRSH